MTLCPKISFITFNSPVGVIRPFAQWFKLKNHCIWLPLKSDYRVGPIHALYEIPRPFIHPLFIHLPWRRMLCYYLIQRIHWHCAIWCDKTQWRHTPNFTICQIEACPIIAYFVKLAVDHGLLPLTLFYVTLELLKQSVHNQPRNKCTLGYMPNLYKLSTHENEFRFDSVTKLKLWIH